MTHHMSQQALSMVLDCANALMDGKPMAPADAAIYGALVRMALDEIRERRADDVLVANAARTERNHLMEIQRLDSELAKSRANEEAIARKSLDDHFEYKRRRNEQFAAYDELLARLKGAEAANAAATEQLVEHSELNGHIERVEECRDYLVHEITDNGDSSGRLQDFVESLHIVVDQLDLQRRQRNWYEVAHTISRQKQIKLAVDRALERARIAAKSYTALVDDLGALADDSDSRMMALAGPIGEAQANLWIALGLDLDEEYARLQADIESRCAVCGWTLADTIESGCVRGNCSYRPRPTKLYAPERAVREHIATAQKEEG